MPAARPPVPKGAVEPIETRSLVWKVEAGTFPGLLDVSQRANAGASQRVSDIIQLWLQPLDVGTAMTWGRW
jgi:hypothetical protein